MPSLIWHERIMGDLSGSLNRLAFLPLNWRYRIVSAALGRQSRYFRTHGFRIVHIESGKVSILVGNGRHLRNRAGGIHSMAASLAGEYAAALVVAQHLARGAKLVVKAVQADFRKPLCGDIRAHAFIDPTQISAMSGTTDGRARIPMQVIDATGKAPIRGYVDVVWRSPKRADRLL
jgi:acyl-coenzyme A thioesterase PaaI-like protein